MKWLILAASSLAVLVAIVGVVGLLLPREHRAVRSVSVHQAPDRVWTVISDPWNAPSWRPGLQSVERLPEQDGRARWREVQASGDSIAFELVLSEPGRKQVVRIADPDLPFGGTWTFELQPQAAGCKVQITEDGTVSNPIYRFVSRFVLGHSHSLDLYLRDLGRRFGEELDPA